MPVELSERERERYRRQLMLPGFTKEHQVRLKASTAFVAGVGGLGGTAALYLAVAGIGRLVLAHAGSLTLSNMNRQVLMEHSGIGRSRVLQARDRLASINPDVAIETYEERITQDNAGSLIRGARVALSARPNFSERAALNRACLDAGIPMIEAAMNGMEGYLFDIVPGRSACLECVYPEPDPEWRELGFPVLGAVSGALGCLMAIEAVKLLTGYGVPLAGRMLAYDTVDMHFRNMKLERRPACPACGNRSSRQERRGPAKHGSRRGKNAGGS